MEVRLKAARVARSKNEGSRSVDRKALPRVFFVRVCRCAKQHRRAPCASLWGSAWSVRNQECRLAQRCNRNSGDRTTASAVSCGRICEVEKKIRSLYDGEEEL